MSERDALLRHVIEHADDDAPRLVMADWFDEHGEPDRAEFIRLQVAIAREDIANDPVASITTASRDSVATATARSDPARRDRLKRMQALHDANRSVWIRDVAKWAWPKVQFSRGFISHVRSTMVQWGEGMPGLFRRAPITDLELSRPAERLGSVASLPALAGVLALGMEANGITADAGEQFAASPYRRRLRSLRLLGGGSLTGSTNLSAILSMSWEELRQLFLGDCITDADLAVLAANPSARSLGRLSVDGLQITTAGVEHLTGSPYLNGVRHLSLLSARLSIGGVAALVSSPYLTGVRQLGLWRCGITAEGVSTLVAGPRFADLEELDLSFNLIGNAGVRALADAPTVGNLRTLDLSYCIAYGDATWLALARSPHLTSLRRLTVNGHAMTEAVTAEFRERFGDDVLCKLGG